jgi:CubicO group peptidase (beta-lactamase class C family)
MRRVWDLMQKGLDDDVFPGGVLLVAKQGRIEFLEAFGRARIEPERTMTTDTVFDLASLTKSLATAVCMMALVQQGKVILDQTLGCSIPDLLHTDKKGITVRQLLCHTSGMPDYRPYYEALRRRPPPERKGEVRKLLLGEALVHEPGKVCLYSDPGFMILEWLIEAISEIGLRPFKT